MKVGEVISAKDLETTIKIEGVSVRQGDVVVIRTGHGQLWMKDNVAFAVGEPGTGMQAARWLSDHKIKSLAAVSIFCSPRHDDDVSVRVLGRQGTDVNVSIDQ